MPANLCSTNQGDVAVEFLARQLLDLPLECFDVSHDLSNRPVGQ